MSEKKTKEDKHTNIDEAKKMAGLYAQAENSLSVRHWPLDDIADYGILRALIAIAEQLRVANLIALANAPEGATESMNTGNEAMFNSEDTAFGRSYHGLRPDIAVILGLDDDHE